MGMNTSAVIQGQNNGTGNVAFFFAKIIAILTALFALSGLVLKLIGQEFYGGLAVGGAVAGFLGMLIAFGFAFGAQSTQETMLKTGILLVGAQRNDAQQNIAYMNTVSDAFQLGAGQGHRLALGSPGAEAKAAFGDDGEELEFPAGMEASLGGR